MTALTRAKQDAGLNFEMYHNAVDLFRANIKYLIYKEGESVRRFFIKLNEETPVHYSAKYIDTNSRHMRTRLNLVHIATFARIFNVPAADLIGTDLKKRDEEAKNNAETGQE